MKTRSVQTRFFGTKVSLGVIAAAAAEDLCNLSGHMTQAASMRFREVPDEVITGRSIESPYYRHIE